MSRNERCSVPSTDESLRRSFGIALALLNKARVSKPDRKRVDEGAVTPINSIYIV